MLAHVLPTVEDVPQFGALVLRVPLPKIVAVREKTLLGAGLLLVTAGATNASIELVFLDGIQQSGGLQTVATGIIALFLLHATFVDTLLHRSHNQLRTQFCHECIPIFERLPEIVPRVDVQQRERYLGRIKGLVG